MRPRGLQTEYAVCVFYHYSLPIIQPIVQQLLPFGAAPVAVAFIIVIESDFSLALVHRPLMTRPMPN